MVSQKNIYSSSLPSSTKYISKQQDYYPNSQQTIHVVSDQHNYCSPSCSYGYYVFMIWVGGKLEAKTICYCSFFYSFLLFCASSPFCRTCYYLLWFQSSCFGLVILIL